jgi:hypothetical protein
MRGDRVAFSAPARRGRRAVGRRYFHFFIAAPPAASNGAGSTSANVRWVSPEAAGFEVSVGWHQRPRLGGWVRVRRGRLRRRRLGLRDAHEPQRALVFTVGRAAVELERRGPAREDLLLVRCDRHRAHLLADVQALALGWVLVLGGLRGRVVRPEQACADGEQVRAARRGEGNRLAPAGRGGPRTAVQAPNVRADAGWRCADGRVAGVGNRA